MPRRKFIYDPEATHADGSKGAMVEVSADFQQPAEVHYVRGDVPGYYSVVSDKWIEGARARRDDLARSGCRPHEGRAQEDKEAARQRAYAEKASERRLTERAERALAQMPLSKRRHLGVND